MKFTRKTLKSELMNNKHTHRNATRSDCVRLHTISTNAIVTEQQKLGVHYYLLAYFSFMPSLCVVDNAYAQPDDDC